MKRRIICPHCKGPIYLAVKTQKAGPLKGYDKVKAANRVRKSIEKGVSRD